MAHALKHTVVWVDIPVIDLDRAVAFYSAVLGTPIEKHEFSPDRALGLLPHSDTEVGGCLYRSADDTPSERGPLIYLNCSDRLDDAIAAVEPNGGQLLQPKHSIEPHGFRALALDSEGNRIALHAR